jgi:hypothetical protein
MVGSGKKVPHPQHFRGLPDKLSAVLPHWNAEDVRTDITQHQPKTAKPNLKIAKEVTNEFFSELSVRPSFQASSGALQSNHKKAISSCKY